MNTYDIRKFKNLRSEYGDPRENGFQATLFRNGTKLGVIEVAPNSGEVNFNWEPVIWRNGLLETLFIDACKALNVKPECHGSFIKQGEYDEGIVLDYINVLISEYEDKKARRRWSKKHCLFIVKGDRKGAYRTLKNRPYSKAAHTYLLNKYDDELLVIFDGLGDPLDGKWVKSFWK